MSESYDAALADMVTAVRAAGALYTALFRAVPGERRGDQTGTMVATPCASNCTDCVLPEV